MEDNKGLKTVLGILAALAIVVAAWRVLSYEAVSQTSLSSPVDSAPQVEVLNDLKRTELLAQKHAAGPAALLPAKKQTSAGGKTAFPIQNPSKLQPYPTGRATPRTPYPGRRVAGSPTSATSPTTNAAVATQTEAGSNTTPSVNLNFTPGGANPQAATEDAIQSERASRMLAPFLRTDRKTQERMDARWNDFAAYLRRAVLQALMPKSKKEQMIEKYAAKPAESAAAQATGFTGALSPVGQALASQKQSVVSDFASAYGKSAAQQAGNIMDRFNGELSAALSTPGLTQEQAGQRVREISNKYQKEMDKLAEKSQYDKFAADLEAKDNQQKDALRARYNDAELNNAFSQIIDQARAEKLALATRQDLTQQEHYLQDAKIDQNTHDKLKEAIAKTGQSLNPFYEVEGQRLQEWLDNLQSQEEEGKIVSLARAASPDEVQEMRTKTNERTEAFMEGVKKSPLFDDTAQLEVQVMINDYKNKLETLYQQKLSPKERADGEVQAWKEVNRALLDKQMEQVKKSNAPQAQKEKVLAELREAYNNIQ